MSKIFDSEVYELRKKVPHARVSLTHLMQDSIWNWASDKDDNGATLECYHRHSVSTRIWWRFSWIEADGKRYTVESQDLDLLSFRAEHVHMRVKRTREWEERLCKDFLGRHSFDCEGGLGI